MQVRSYCKKIIWRRGERGKQEGIYTKYKLKIQIFDIKECVSWA